MKNYYKVLGVEIEASNRKIRKALFSKAKYFHKNQESKQDFIELLEAYEVLNHENGRKIYNGIRDLNVERLKMPKLEKQVNLVLNLAKSGRVKGKGYSTRKFREFKDEYILLDWWDYPIFLLKLIYFVSKKNPSY